MSNKAAATDMKEEARRKTLPRLRFPEFQGAPEWGTTALDSKVAKIGSGITPTGGDKNYKNKGRPFIRSQNVGWGELILADVAFIDDTTHATFLATEIKEGDVLLNITGASIGRSAVADSRIHGGNVNQHVCIIRPITKELSSEFLNQYLLSQYGQNQVDSFQAGGNRQGLNFAQIRSFSIPLPQRIEEQQKIAECLSSVDELIAAQGQKLETLKTHKKGLLQQLFPAEGQTLPQLRFPGYKDQWKKGTVDNLANTVMGNAFKSSDFVESGTQLVRMGNLYQGELQLNRVPVYLPVLFNEEYSKFLVKPLDLLMSMTGTVGKKDYGFIVQVPKNCKPLLLNQRVMKIVPKENCSKGFLLQLLKSESLLNKLYLLPGGTKQANLSAQQLKDLEISFPHKAEQQKIAACLSSIDELIAAQGQKLEALKAHKRGLLQQLFPAPDEVPG